MAHTWPVPNIIVTGMYMCTYWKNTFTLPWQLLILLRYNMANEKITYINCVLSISASGAEEL